MEPVDERCLDRAGRLGRCRAERDVHFVEWQSHAVTSQALVFTNGGKICELDITPLQKSSALSRIGAQLHQLGACGEALPLLENERRPRVVLRMIVKPAPARQQNGTADQQRQRQCIKPETHAVFYPPSQQPTVLSYKRLRPREGAKGSDSETA